MAETATAPVERGDWDELFREAARKDSIQYGFAGEEKGSQDEIDAEPE